MEKELHRLIDTERIEILGGLANPRVIEILSGFIAELGIYLRVLESIRRTGDFEELQRVLHRLKGAAGSCGFQAIAEAAADLQTSEDAFADRKHAELATRIRASVHEWEHLIESTGNTRR